MVKHPHCPVALLMAAAGLAATTFESTALAQNYPAKSIRVLVGFTPGAGVDIAVRLIAPKMGEALGQSLLVDNRPGAGGNIASELAARAPADGYTLLANGAPAAISQSLYARLSYDLLRDFEAVALIATVSQLLVVHPSLPAKNVKELVAIARQRRGELSFATTGSGSSPHLTTEMLKLAAGIQILHVPYRGTPPAITDLMAGNVSFMFGNTLSVLPHVHGKRLRALAITTAKRSALTPDVPTVAETYPGFESGSWYCFFTPAGTSKEVISRLNEVVNRTMQTPEIRDKFIAQGSDPLSGSPQDAAAYTRAEVVKWAKVVKASGAKAE